MAVLENKCKNNFVIITNVVYLQMKKNKTNINYLIKSL